MIFSSLFDFSMFSWIFEKQLEYLLGENSKQSFCYLLSYLREWLKQALQFREITNFLLSKNKKRLHCSFP